MKVKIGPYKNWFGPYQLAELLCFWVPKREDQYGLKKHPDWVHNFGEWLSYGRVIEDDDFVKGLRQTPTTLLYKFFSWVDKIKKRTVKVHIDYYDTWSMDHTLALIILPMLKQLQEKQHGAPGDMLEFGQTTNSSRQLCFDFYAEDDDKAWNAGHERWNEIMNKMIWSFEELALDKEKVDAFYIDGKYNIEAHEQYVKKMNEGFMLFGKYYRGLWD